MQEADTGLDLCRMFKYQYTYGKAQLTGDCSKDLQGFRSIFFYAGTETDLLSCVDMKLGIVCDELDNGVPDLLGCKLSSTLN